MFYGYDIRVVQIEQLFTYYAQNQFDNLLGSCFRFISCLQKKITYTLEYATLHKFESFKTMFSKCFKLKFSLHNN